MSLQVLFLGGAGMIGSAAAAEVIRSGADLTVVTRQQPRRRLPDGVRQLRGDVRDANAMRGLLGGDEFDVVVNWVGYTPSHVQGDIGLYAGRAAQYVFISTCSVFARPVPQLPIVESTPKRQPVFGYAREKIACEETLMAAYRDDGFPLTVVRPFHTYDRTVVPLLAGWTAVERMRAGQPVVVHGDGTSLWCLTHADDFARAFVPLLGNMHAIGEDVNVVSGDITTWDQIHLALAAAAGVRAPRLVHRSSETIARHVPQWADVLEHDFRHSMLFDTSKLARLVPAFAPRISLSTGLREVVEHHDEESSRQRIDGGLSEAFDRLVAEP